MRTIKAVFLGVLFLTLAGCQTMRVIERPTPAEISRLDRDEVVGVLLVDGTRHELAVTAVTDTHLTGSEQGRTVVVPIEAIEELRHQERTTSRSSRNALQRVLAAIAASIALATGDQDTVNAPAD